MTTTVRSICPRCGGKDFVTTTTAGGMVMFICHRASCGYRGRRNLVGAQEWGEFRPAPPKPKLYQEPSYHRMPELQKAVLRMLCGGDLAGVYKSRNAVVYECYNYYGEKFGHTNRHYSFLGEQRGAKAALHLLDGQEVQPHFPRKCREHPTTQPLLLVEDIPSAMKACHFVPAASLLGTNLSKNMASIIRENFSSVCLALDADALSKQVKLMKDIDIMFDSVYTAVLHKDIKDMSMAEAQEFLLSLEAYGS